MPRVAIEDNNRMSLRIRPEEKAILLDSGKCADESVTTKSCTIDRSTSAYAPQLPHRDAPN